MTPLNLRSYEVCSGVGMAARDDVPVEVLELVLGSREEAENEQWRRQCARRNQEVAKRFGF